MPACPICYEDMETRTTVTTVCNHTFCLSCVMMMRSYNNNNSCPLCRGDILSTEELISENEIVPVFTANHSVNIIVDNTDNNIFDNTNEIENMNDLNMNDLNINVIPNEDELNIDLDDNIINLDIDIINNIINDDIINLDNNTLSTIFSNNNYTPNNFLDIINIINYNNLNTFNNITTQMISN